LVAFGGSNLLAGLSQGFVQLGGSSQTAAAARAGGKSQLASVVAAVLVVLTGIFLAGLFEDLPQATLGAIVVVAVASFVRIDELERFARLRTSALVLSLVAIVGVLVLGVLPGLIVLPGCRSSTSSGASAARRWASARATRCRGRGGGSTATRTGRSCPA
jgi:sulfate permease, SulP family